ncbi:MAG TPA: aminotransferase class V-fold PLP-dependent enzyme [Thermoanaerobaculia bacterium]|nr:aminotransferase class V-fold PLP-dependent enzyme [Thermoanaerobaculia bacterium]
MISRRRFITTGSLAVAGGAALPLIAETPRKPAATPAGDLRDWVTVREQFDLDPTHIHLGLFFLASHPRPVRQAIEEYRRKIDANPLVTVEHAMFSEEENLQEKVCTTIARYIGGAAGDIALTQNTTTGLALLYLGLPLKPGDEVLATTHDHYVHHEAIRLATERAGASWRRIPLFGSYDAVSAEEITARIRKEIGPKTRALGITWVHSSSGVKLPLKRIAGAVAEVNAGRPPSQRVLLLVDGVHGLGVEEPEVVATGIDAFAAGTHKWIFGPRGTGFVWAKPEVWSVLRPIVPSFSAPELFMAWAAEKPPAAPARASWFSPGGFQAYEHYWALPSAFEFHRRIGPGRITNRIHELNAQVKEGLAKMPHVVLYTPRSRELSSGMVCFDVKGMAQNEVVRRLLERHRIVASATPYRDSYARVAFGIQNTTEEVEKTLAAVRTLS